MKPLEGTTPEQFVADFFTSYVQDVVHSGDDPGPLADRYYAPDIVQISDGMELDREGLLAHARTLRKNLLDCRFEVHEALAAEGRIAARFTIHARMRKGPAVAREVHMFGELTPEGRLRRVTQLSRTLPATAVRPEQEQR
ncbi:nuclear transport factor 2 family protein [Streptomyces sp. NPDC004284]|uniref:nuclear transport factor 2 family protein n=1 Tax=Streptomyces sp. NPDC004284 TaxID=3364695 RepID=UPI0036D0BB1B